jgi:hypothetical protein
VGVVEVIVASHSYFHRWQLKMSSRPLIVMEKYLLQHVLNMDDDRNMGRSTRMTMTMTTTTLVMMTIAMKVESILAVG